MTAKKFFSFIFLGLSLIGGVFSSWLSSSEPIIIESIESKTEKGHPVFNQITLESSSTKDVWKMRQSHAGRKAELSTWDEIMITVDKSQKPFIVSYGQFRDGKEIELKASCFTCHANGPRNIRPELQSKLAPPTLKEKAIISLWNLRMKSYGLVKIDDNNFQLNGTFRRVPLRFFGKTDRTPLKIKTCLYCHNSQDFWGRGNLERQHAATIAHLVKRKEMPPWPFTLGTEEKAQLDAFLKGF